MIKQDGVLLEVNEEDLKLLSKNPRLFWKDVEKVSKDAFLKCKLLLKKIKIPNNVKIIEENVFSGCHNLIDVKLPKKLQEIKLNTFKDCFSLKKITMPKGIKYIRHGAFHSCKNLKKIVLPKKLEVIENYVFSKCESLSNISIPNRVKEIGDTAFRECRNLKNITIPGSVKKIKGFVFQGANIDKIVLEEGIESISTRAFIDCSINEIKLPNTLREIEWAAFTNGSIKNIELPSNLKKLGAEAFARCKNLEKITIPPMIKELYGTFFACLNLKEVTLNDGLTTIGAKTFKNSGIKIIEIPASVTTIEEEAFEKCFELEEVLFKGDIKEIQSSAFLDCKKLKKVELPSGLKTIGSMAFYGSGLEEIIFNKEVTNIKGNAFSRCVNLKQINVPGNVISIGNSAFSGCENLKYVNIEEGLHDIKDHAFSWCENLEKVELPNTLNQIGKNVFENCKNINEIILPEHIETMTVESFKGLDNMYVSLVNDGDKKVIISKAKPNNSEISYNIGNQVAFTPKSGYAIKNFFESKSIILPEDKEINEYLLKYKVDLPYEFITRLKEHKQLDNFINNTNLKNIKKLNNLIKHFEEYKRTNLIDYYTFAYNIGCLSKDSKLANTAYTWLESKMKYNERKEKYELDFREMHANFEGMPPLGEDKEFSEFLFGKDPRKKELTFDELLREENYGYFIKNIYREYMNKETSLLPGGRFRDAETGKLKFKFFREAVDANGERILRPKELLPTLDVFKEYFASIKFNGIITEEDKKIANELGKWPGLMQEDFEQAQSIMNNYNGLNIDSNIVGKHLKDINNEINLYRQQSELLAKEGIEIAREVVNKLSNVVEKEFTYDWLEKNDPMNFVLGLYCNCCASLSGVGYGIMHASIIHPDIQNLVIKDKKGVPVAKSTIYVNRKEGYALFNNVEVSHNSDSLKDKIYEEYMKGVEAFALEYNKRNPDNPLKKINVGINLNDLSKQIMEGRMPSEMLQGIDFSKYGKGYLTYTGDWSKGNQYTIWENEDLKENNGR